MRKRSRRFESLPMQAPDGNFVVFFEKLESRAPEGEPPKECWVEWMQIANPGQKDVPEFQLNEIRRQKYHEIYGRWLASKTGGEGEIFEGTLLTDWPQISIERAEEIRTHRVFTVEMLAAVSDANIHVLGSGSMLLREKAKEFVLAKRRAAPLDDLRNQLAAMQQQMTELAKGGLQSVAAPAVNMQVLIDEAVAKALAGVSKANSKSKAKPRGRPSRKERSPAVAEAAETPPAA